MTALLEARHVTKAFGQGFFNRGKPLVALNDLNRLALRMDGRSAVSFNGPKQPIQGFAVDAGNTPWQRINRWVALGNLLNKPIIALIIIDPRPASML